MQIGVAWALTILFIALKLMGYIDWSWIWVLAPLWVGVVLVLLLIFVLGMTGTLSIRKRSKEE